MDFTSLINQLKRPTLYEKSSHPFWDDPHISKGMLAAHLAPNWDAASRRASFIDASAAWIKEILPPKAYPSLLDLGCGPGLYAERFCLAGYHVTGIDLSTRSIAYAKQMAAEQGLSIDYHRADYLTCDLHCSFDLATLIYCDYGALPREDRSTLLQNTCRQLRPGGRLLLDVSSLFAYQQFEESQTWSLCPEGGYWSEQPYLALEQKLRFCETVTLHQASILTQDTMATHFIWHTYFSPEDVEKEAIASGFSLIGTWSDVAGAPYCKNSPTIALLFEK